RREAARAQRRGERARAAAERLLHEGGRHPPRRDVHRGRAHGRHRVGRGGQRRRLGHRARDGAGARAERPRREDRALDPLRALEQRGDGAQRRARLRGPAAGAAGAREPGRLGSLPGAQVAGDDPARHDAVRPRDAARRRDDEPRAAPRGRRERRVPGGVQARGRVAGAGLALPAGEREVRHRLPGRGGEPHDEHRLRPLPGPRAGDQPPRERARHAGGQRLGPALAPAHGPVRDVRRQGLPPRAQRGADDAGRGEPARRRDAHAL
ncbi:MAG: Leucine aminopeptidase-related protein, partial [uncultured Gemmatimonadaceae bacterium]